MEQKSFSSIDFSVHYKSTKRQEFLQKMDQIMPWKEITAIIEPYYPKSEMGRPAIGLGKMIRIHFLQHWFSLSDPAAEEAIHDSVSMREFSGIDLGNESAPDETTICKFRHLLEKHSLGKKIMEAVNLHLSKSGIKVSSGSIVDATIISAPSSTKNIEGKRDPEMHQTKKGNQWYFGMKLHIGVDSKSQIIHSLQTTPANVHDSRVLPQLLHGKEKRYYGDSAYYGQKQRVIAVAPGAKDFTNKKGFRHKHLSDRERQKNHNKSSIRVRVEYPFLVLKHLWNMKKVRYKGIAKNTNWYYISCSLVNIYISRKTLLTL